MSTYQTFLDRTAAIADDPVHAAKIKKATDNHGIAVDAMIGQQFRHWQSAREHAAAVKDAALSRLPDMLEQFEAEFTARGGTVLWATDVAEAQAHIATIIERHGATSAIKSKSMISEEIELNDYLEAHGIDVLESDLGELIVQLAGEKPYHIVTPAMHKSKDEIATLFHETLGTPLDATAEELTMVARAHLRAAFTRADIGFSGVNFLIADTGGILVTENEGNARLSMGCPPVHVAISGIEKVLPRMADLPFFLPLLATSGTGQQVTCYNTIVRGPRHADEPDGPEHAYVILLDNGRSRLYAQQEVRRVLRCIKCGSCLNACPVYRTIGGHAYGTTYQGPVGVVITPHFKGHADWQHLPQASSLCGACSDVCPVNIDLHRLILHNRWDADRHGDAPRFWRWAMKAWALGNHSPTRLRLARTFCQHLGRHLPMPAAVRHKLPDLAPTPFRDQWQQLADAPPPRRKS